MKKLIVLVVCLLLGFSTGALATVEPVAHWSFDNTADIGHDDADSHNGNPVGNPISTPGVWGNAVKLDGASYLDVADAPDLNPTSAITITAWFKADSFALRTYSWPHIVDKFGPDKAGYFMLIWNVYENNPSAGFAVQLEEQGQESGVMGTPLLEENTWYFAAGVYDGDTAKVYVGTSELPPLVITSASYSGNMIPSSNNLNIGRDVTNPSSTERFFDGAIDEVRIYDRALNSDEITNLYLYNTPEPASLFLLTLGGLILRRRK